MSVSAVVTYRPGVDDDHAPSLLPVATEEVFHRYWLPLADRLDQPTVAAFGTGVMFQPADFDALRDELSAFIDGVREVIDEGNTAVSPVLERALLLFDFIGRLDRERVDELFIG
jgi:hypothetical protein